MFGDSDEKPNIYYEIVSKKNELEANLKRLEKSIYDYETKYLEGSHSTGNILKGWDHIFTAKSKLSSSTQAMFKHRKCSMNERIFSQTSFHNLNIKDDGLNSNNHQNILKHSNLSSNNFETNKDNLLRKKIKKKILTSLSLKKKKAGLNGITNKNGNDLNN